LTKVEASSMEAAKLSAHP